MAWLEFRKGKQGAAKTYHNLGIAQWKLAAGCCNQHNRHALRTFAELPCRNTPLLSSSGILMADAGGNEVTEGAHFCSPAPQFPDILPPPKLPPMKHFDCVVIGTGPAGQKGAIQAAKLGKRVAIIEKTRVLGGAQINTGTIPSKALREAVLHLTGAAQRGLFGSSYRVKKHITIADLVAVSQTVIRHEWDLILNQFERNGIELLWGTARFAGQNELYVEGPEAIERISADKFLVAVGTRPHGRPAFPSTIAPFSLATSC